MNINFYRLNKTKKLLLFEINTTKFEEDVCLNEICEMLKDKIDILQIKNKSLSTKDFVSFAQKVKLVCSELDIIFLTTDRCDVSIAANSDGIVLCEGELSSHFAKHLIGEDKIIGSYDLKDEQADFYIVKNNEIELNSQKVYFKKDEINKDCLKCSAVFRNLTFQ